MIPTSRIICGHNLDELANLPEKSVHCCVTSPPYWGLRDYKLPPMIWGGDPSCQHDWSLETKRVSSGGLNSVTVGGGYGQSTSEGSFFVASTGSFCIKCDAWIGSHGLEPTPQLYIKHEVMVFRSVHRVLRDDGTLWLNLGDSYVANRGGQVPQTKDHKGSGFRGPNRDGNSGLAPKNLVGIPWRVAFALQDAGWYLRSEIIWAKRNCMPESVTDRPSKSHEQIFLLSKQPDYFYDHEAVKVPASDSFLNDSRWETGSTATNYKFGYEDALAQNPKKPHSVFNGDKHYRVNLRDVWTVANRPFKESHFAVFPPELIKPCIMAGTSEKGCCPECGSPWERILETSPMEIKRSDRGEKIFNGHSTQASGTMTKPPESKTVGWTDTCTCGRETEEREGNDGCLFKPIPCTVLDPFGGSCTTGMVATELGRNSICIELNPEYVEIGKRRTDVTPGLPI